MVNKSDLTQQKLFSELNDAELGTIAEKIVSEKYAKGTTILKEGDPTKGIYLIHKGKVEISKITPDGWKQTLAFLGEHHFFGELSVIEDRIMHSADVTAVDDSECFLIRKEDLRELEEKAPAMMYKIMRAIARVASRNVRSMNEKLMKALISY
jgi:CRP/FNR family transcriptional regulator